MIESAGNGYRLDPSSIELDADRLAAAVESADLATIDEMLARWQGPAFPDLADVDDGRAESARLEELRIRAVETRAESQAVGGCHRRPRRRARCRSPTTNRSASARARC